jgi:hypothetical protein
MTPSPAATATPAIGGAGSWTTTRSMNHPRSYGSTATVLQDGRVLVAGGEAQAGDTVATAEIYDPATGTWTDTGSMLARRRGHTSTLLPDGRVLVAGGWSLDDPNGPPLFAELYDPATGRWRKTGSLRRWRLDPLALRLPRGRILLMGGFINGLRLTNTAETYDPASSTWRSIRRMSAPPSAAAVLADGRVLVLHAGRTPEVYDPKRRRWTRTAGGPNRAAWAQAIGLADGDVLVLNTEKRATQIYDPATGTWTASPGPKTGAGPAVLLADGTVLLLGRVSSARYDPATGSWIRVGRPPLPRDYALESPRGIEVNLAVPLLDGRLLATENGSAAVFDPTGR